MYEYFRTRVKLRDFYIMPCAHLGTLSLNRVLFWLFEDGIYYRSWTQKFPAPWDKRDVAKITPPKSIIGNYSS